MLFFWLTSSAIVITARLSVRYMLCQLRLHGRNLRYVLILGTNGRAVEFARRIEGDPELGYRVLGFVDGYWDGYQDFLQTGYRLCCNFDGLSEYLRRNVIDEVAMYLPVRSFYEYTSQVAALCEQHGIKMRFASDMFNLKIARAYADEIDGDAHITAHSGSTDNLAIMVKRAFDIVVSFGLLVAFALATRGRAIGQVHIQGSVMFTQERVGLNKRRFRIYKFRNDDSERRQAACPIGIVERAVVPIQDQDDLRHE